NAPVAGVTGQLSAQTRTTPICAIGAKALLALYQRKRDDPVLSFRAQWSESETESRNLANRNPLRDVSTSLDMTSKTETREVYSFSLTSTLRTGSVDQADGSAVHQS